MPPVLTLLTPADGRRVPWRNGLGLTTEIALEAVDGGRFLWRVSVADVAAAGPFSAFPGYDRLIAVVEGPGMRLTVDGAAPVERRRMESAFAFPGEAAVDCTLLGGPIRDFNLMLDRATAKGAVTMLAGPLAHAAEADAVLVHALAGTLTVTAAEGGEAIAVPAGYSVLVRGGAATVTVPEDGEGVCAEVWRRG
ncbi:HutD/Ves family protein [Azospirillum doebereinerae]|uniref:HutD family protein n=1 Tax=Azospirillum doebereinerae TaxID=92933 RepID=A0A433J5C6_9PROT|nr:HutD family protein [Azospirillum doebereinerae]MCG5240330.1 HutD family protein [Azospirillum doebereinerae]RUQ67776.1 HutD family protein [Azospirillum doebereinerae]